MRELNIDIPLKAVSQNNATKITRSGRGYKSAEAKDFHSFLFKWLMNNNDIILFRNTFNPYKNYITIGFTFYFNHKKLLTKKNKLGRKLSANVGDVSNYIKWTEDCLMRYIGIDDRFVQKLVDPEKLPCLEDDHISVTLKIENLSDHPVISQFLELD